MPLATISASCGRSPRRRGGRQGLSAAFQRRCGRTHHDRVAPARCRPGRRSVLMGLIRASHLRDTAAATARRTDPLPKAGGAMKRCIVSAPRCSFGLMLHRGDAWAMDLGVIGPTYEISEPHLLQMIEQRLREKERSGELGAWKRSPGGNRDREEPPPVTGLRPTERCGPSLRPELHPDRNILGPRANCAVCRRHAQEPAGGGVAVPAPAVLRCPRPASGRPRPAVDRLTRAASNRSWSAAPT